MTRLLLDTHAILWWLADDERLGDAARAAITDAPEPPFVSVASLWEAAIKRSLRKLRAPDDLPDVIVAQGFSLLPVLPAHAWAVRNLKRHHGDPFDRLLVAQARAERLTLCSGDGAFGPYDVRVIW